MDKSLSKTLNVLRVLFTLPASALAAIIAYVTVGVLGKLLQIACVAAVSDNTNCSPPELIAWWVILLLLSVACATAWLLAGYFTLPFRSRRANWIIFGSGALVSMALAAFFGLANLQLVNYVMGSTVLLASWITGIVITIKLNRGITAYV